jgi:hypothetical protein
MLWSDVRAAHPDQWLVIEALEAHTEKAHRVFERLAVVELCSGGTAALRRYRELRSEHPGRELYFVHTGNAELDVEERSWIGIRRNDASDSAR